MHRRADWEKGGASAGDFARALLNARGLFSLYQLRMFACVPSRSMPSSAPPDDVAIIVVVFKAKVESPGIIRDTAFRERGRKMSRHHVQASIHTAKHQQIGGLREEAAKKITKWRNQRTIQSVEGLRIPASPSGHLTVPVHGWLSSGL